MNFSEQLKFIEATLLSSVVTRPPEKLSQTEQLAVRAYLTLCHAIIEEHVEDSFEAHFNQLIPWSTEQLVPMEFALLMHSVGENTEKALKSSYARRTATGVLQAYRKQYEAKIRANHGITQEKIEQMASFAGLNWPDMVATLNSEFIGLNTLASKRGLVAHLSPFTTKVQGIVDTFYPENVIVWVEDGAEAAVAIRRYLRAILAAQLPGTLIADRDGN